MGKLSQIFETTDGHHTLDADATLILTDIYRTMKEAQRQQLVAVPTLLANRLGPESIPGSSVTVKLQDKDSLAFARKGEGAKAYEDAPTYSSLTFTPLVYSADIPLTDEVMEDSLFDLLRLATTEAGYQAAKRIDKLFFAAVESGSTSASHDVSLSGNMTVANILSAQNNLRADDYTPTDIVLNVNHVDDIMLLDTFTEKDKAGVNDPSQGLIGRIFNMNVHVTNNSNTSNTSYVLDRANAVLMAEKRPLRVEPWRDGRAGKQGFTATFRTTLGYYRDQANSVLS